jgi:hypothetical protein
MGIWTSIFTLGKKKWWWKTLLFEIILLSYSSYWESADVISFVLRQLVRCNADLVSDPRSTSMMHHHNTLEMDQPREKWNKKRTSVKIRNGAPNHRANDIIVKEGNSQVVRIYYPFFMGVLFINRKLFERYSDRLKLREILKSVSRTVAQAINHITKI